MTRIPLSDFLGGGAAVAPAPQRMKLEDFLSGGSGAQAAVMEPPAPLSVPFANQPTQTDPLTELLSGGPADPEWIMAPPTAPPVQGIPSVQGVLDNYNLSGYVDPGLKNPPSFELPKSALTPPGIRNFTERQRAEERRRAEEERAAFEAAFAPDEPADAEGQYAKMQRRAKYYETLPYKITADVQSDPETFEKYRRLNELATGGPLLDVPAENRAAAQEAINATLADMKANGIDDPVRWMMEIDSFDGPQGIVGRNASAAWEQTKRSGANIFDALTDPAGNDTLGTRQRQMEAGWQEGVEDVKDERSPLGNVVNEVARATSQSAPQLAAAAGVGYATKNPALAWATLLGPSGVENFQVGRTNGLTNAEAAGRAVALAGVEYATAKVGGKVAEKFGMKTFEELAFGTGAKAAATGTLKPITRAIGGSVIEGGEEVAAGVAQQFSDFVVGLEDELVGDETPEQLALAFAVGMVASGAMHLPTFANFVQNPTVENAEAAGITESLASTQVDRESLATAAAAKIETLSTADPVVEDAEFEMQPDTAPVAPEPIQAEIPAPPRKRRLGERPVAEVIAEQDQRLADVLTGIEQRKEPPQPKRRLGERITAPPVEDTAPTLPVAPPDAPPVAPSRAPADSGVAPEVVAPTVVEAPKKNPGQKPDDRPAIYTQETRGKGQQYHGTSATALSPTNDHYSTLNYYGQGFYTTDAMDVAYGYSKRGAKRSGKRGVWRIEEKRPLNIYDAEQPISPEVMAMLNDVAESQGILGDSIDQKPANLRELYDDFRDHSRDNGLSADTVQETFDTLTYRLQRMGYDGISHKGGLRTDTKAHTVKIYFNPEQDIAVSEVVPAEPIPLPSIKGAEKATGKKSIGQKTPAPVEESLPDWVTESDAPTAPSLDKKQKTKLNQLHRRFTNRIDKETHDQLLEMPERDQHAIAIEAERRADTANEFVRQVIDDFNQLQAKGSIPLIARNKERAGKDPSSIPGFDLLVQQLRDGDYPSLASYAESRGQGNLEAGLNDIVQGGKKALESLLVGPETEVFDVLEEYRERLERSPTQEGGEPDGQVSEAGFDDQPGNVERDGGDARAGTATPATSEAGDFQLTGEGSTDATPIVEPYQPERIPPKRKAQRQPQLEGLPEDLDESVLAGQQGLFSATSGDQLQPSTPKVIVTPPKSQREIINALSKSLDIPIRFGRMVNKKAGGVFFRNPNLIQSKKANDVPVVTHEVGHKLDAMFKLSSDKNIAAELNNLGDPKTPGSRSSWTKSKTPAYKLGEGMAEFVRYWMTDPKKAKADAPQTHAAFEAVLDANKDLGDSMRQAQEDIRLWRTAQPQARLRSQISIGDNPNKTRYSLSQLTRDLVDDLHYLKLAVEDAKLGEPGLKPSQNPYLLARNLRGSYGMASTFIQNGAVKFESKDVALGTSLEDALKPVGGRINDFRDWIVAKRSQELESQGRATGLVKSDIDAVAEKFNGDAEFEKAFSDVKKWNDAVLQYSIDAGLVTPESAATIREMNQDYVPFHRLFEVGAGEAPSNESTGKGSGLNPGKPGSLKRLKGSTRDIVDPLETMVKNAYAIITASEKSAISLAVADMAKLPNMGKWVERVAGPMQQKTVRVDEIIDQLADLGADVSNLEKSADALTFFRQATRPPKGENTISVVRNGKPEFYRLNRYLHDTFEALDLDDAGKLVRILSAPAQLLRAGVTLEPGFNIANMMRDTFGAAVVGKYGALPFETTLRGLAALTNKPQLVAEWAASGGRSSVEANYFDRKKMQKYLAERISKDLTPAERALIVAKSPLTALRWMSSTFEEATRIGEYQKAFDSLKASGMADGEARRLAAFEARDRQDFAKGGAKTKILRHVAAFWNAQLQANVRLAQSFKERPVQTIAKGLAFVTLPKLLEQAINWDDEDYWQRPQWERDLFYMIPIGKDDAGHTRFLRIPIPFEIGVIFGTVPGRFLQWAKTNDPDAVKELPGFLLKQTVPVPNPSGAVTVMELLPDQGYSYFRGREIVPDSMADKPKDLQWTEQTSTLAKKIGQATGLSPMKVDYFIESTTGGLGKVALGKQVPGERFVTNPLANVGQPIADFYEIRQQLTEDAERIKATGEHQGFGPVMLAEFEEAGEKMGALRNRARETEDPVEKAMLDDEAYQIAVETLRKYRDNPEPEEAVKAYSERHAERALKSDGRPHQRKKKLGSKEPAESDADYAKRLQDWEVKRDASLDWLKAHKNSPAVQSVIAQVAKDIPPYPEFKPNASGVDVNYNRQVAEWELRYGKSKQVVESLK